MGVNVPIPQALEEGASAEVKVLNQAEKTRSQAEMLLQAHPEKSRSDMVDVLQAEIADEGERMAIYREMRRIFDERKEDFMAATDIDPVEMIQAVNDHHDNAERESGVGIISAPDDLDHTEHVA